MKQNLLTSFCCFSSSITLAFSSSLCLAQEQVPNKTNVERIEVLSEKLFKDTVAVSPSSDISADELKTINLVTAEDVVSYEPNVVIRRRYVGDPNGVVGIRGSGMFQTARSLVFADGLPLHYLLQTRWSGSPRWSLVGPDEIASATVIYGPYSAEYAGNAMGGVINLSTRNPNKERFVIQGTLINQHYDHLGTNDKFNGHKTFVSYENKINDFGYYVSYMRLKNDSHPLTNYFSSADQKPLLDAIQVEGYIEGKDDHGRDVLYIGDSGAERSITSLYKGKFTYDHDSVQFRSVIAYEDRERQDTDKRNYLTDSQGNTYWGIGKQNFEFRYHDRNSLLVGLGVSGDLGHDWIYDFYATDFSIKKDVETRSGLNPHDPAFGDKNGRKTTYKNTGWQTAAFKLGTDSWLNKLNHRISLGFSMDKYDLAIAPEDINALTGEFVKARTESSGSTTTKAFFTQYGWRVTKQWDLALGLRVENWQTEQGRFGNTLTTKRDKSSVSPKFSLAFFPSEQQTLRYAIAKATRFPIAEELYRNESATTNIVVADSSLKPESGIFQNLSFAKHFDNGKWQINAFHENIDDTIYHQSGTFINDGVNVHISTFLGIDSVESKGAEFLYQQSTLFNLPLSVRFNVSYTDAKIKQNKANKAIEGNHLPRIPYWRANAMLSYRMLQDVDINLTAKFASNAYSELDNEDNASKVYGSIDKYLFVNSRVNWQLNEEVRLSLGIDNVFNELAYVASPYPSRTVFLEAQYVLE